MDLFTKVITFMNSKRKQLKSSHQVLEGDLSRGDAILVVNTSTESGSTLPMISRFFDHFYLNMILIASLITILIPTYPAL